MVIYTFYAMENLNFGGDKNGLSRVDFAFTDLKSGAYDSRHEFSNGFRLLTVRAIKATLTRSLFCLLKYPSCFLKG